MVSEIPTILLFVYVRLHADAVTTGSFDDSVHFKIASCAGAIVKAFKSECRRVPVHDFIWLAFTSSSHRKFEEMPIQVKICRFSYCPIYI